MDMDCDAISGVAVSVAGFVGDVDEPCEADLTAAFFLNANLVVGTNRLRSDSIFCCNSLICY